MTEAAVIGGGIAGCATAALLAERGAAVTLYEREAIAAGASGRNSGIAPAPARPAARPALRGVAGALPLARPRVRAAARADRRHRHLARSRRPEARLRGRRRGVPRPGSRVARGRRPDLGRARPGARPDRLPGGRRPAGGPDGGDPRLGGARTRGRREVSRSARRRRSQSATDAPRVSWSAGARGRRIVVIATAGPWTPEACGLPLPVSALWGVVAQVRLPSPPHHALEEAGVESLTRPDGAPAELFSLITTADGSAVGSTFSAGRAGSGADRPASRSSGRGLCPGARRGDDRERARLRAPAVSRRAAAARPDRRSRACTWSPATARGGSRSGRARHGWWSKRCATGGRSRQSWPRRASSRRRRYSLVFASSAMTCGRRRCRRCGTRRRACRRARRPRRDGRCRSC